MRTRRPPAVKSTVADRINARLVQMGLSQAECARRAGVSRMTISCLCRGVITNPESCVFELADALDCDPRWLVKGITEDEARKARTEGKA